MTLGKVRRLAAVSALLWIIVALYAACIFQLSSAPIQEQPGGVQGVHETVNRTVETVGGEGATTHTPDVEHFLIYLGFGFPVGAAVEVTRVLRRTRRAAADGGRSSWSGRARAVRSARGASTGAEEEAGSGPVRPEGDASARGDPRGASGAGETRSPRGYGGGGDTAPGAGGPGGSGGEEESPASPGGEGGAAPPRGAGNSDIPRKLAAGWSGNGTKVSLALSTLFIFLYAISDEVHQYFVPMREASVIDVLIDTAGGLIGVAAVLLSIRALAGPVNQRGKQGGGA